MRAQRVVVHHASGRGPARPWWASPLFRVEDEGDDRNDARVAHARPIVAHNHGSWPCGQMLPRRRDRAGTRTWRSIGVTRRHCPIPPAAGPPPNLSANSEENRLSKRTKLHPSPTRRGPNTFSGPSARGALRGSVTSMPRPSTHFGTSQGPARDRGRGTLFTSNGSPPASPR